MITSDASTGLAKTNTVHYLQDNDSVVQFVRERLKRLKDDRILTMTIRLAKSGGCFAATVITGLSDDTPTQVFSDVLPTIYK